MSEVLDLPPIDESALSALRPGPVVHVPHAGTAVATVDLKALALSRFGEWKPAADALIQKYKGVVFDAAKPKEYDALVKAIAEVRAPRFAAQNVSKASKSELAAVSKAVGAEEAAVAAYLEATETELVAQRDAEDKRRAEAKAEAKRIEDARIAKHEAGIAVIRSYLALAQGHPSATIARGIAKIEAMTFDEGWEEFAVPAANAQCETLEALRALMATTKAAEDAAEAARVERERLATVAAEQAAAQKKLDDERAELAREKAEWLAAQKPVVAQATAEPLEPAPAPIAQPPAPAEVKPVEVTGALASGIITGETGRAAESPVDTQALGSDDDDLETLLRDCYALVLIAAQGVASKKAQTASWWTDLAAHVTDLQPRLTTALEDY